METIRLPHLESYPLYAGIFTDVRNADFLQTQLRQGNTDFEYTFLDAGMVSWVIHSREPLLSSVISSSASCGIQNGLSGLARSLSGIVD